MSNHRYRLSTPRTHFGRYVVLCLSFLSSENGNENVAHGFQSFQLFSPTRSSTAHRFQLPVPTAATFAQRAPRIRSAAAASRNNSAEPASDSPSSPPILPNTSDPFILLDLDRRKPLNKRTIKSAYRRQTRTYHPDVVLTRTSTDQERQRASENFAKINSAYETLLERSRVMSNYAPTSAEFGKQTIIDFDDPNWKGKRVTEVSKGYSGKRSWRQERSPTSDSSVEDLEAEIQRHQERYERYRPVSEVWETEESPFPVEDDISAPAEEADARATNERQEYIAENIEDDITQQIDNEIEEVEESIPSEQAKETAAELREDYMEEEGGENIEEYVEAESSAEHSTAVCDSEQDAVDAIDGIVEEADHTQSSEDYTEAESTPSRDEDAFGRIADAAREAMFDGASQAMAWLVKRPWEPIRREGTELVAQFAKNVQSTANDAFQQAQGVKLQEVQQQEDIHATPKKSTDVDKVDKNVAHDDTTITKRARWAMSARHWIKNLPLNRGHERALFAFYLLSGSIPHVLVKRMITGISSLSSALQCATCLIWSGMILGVSFLEAWTKFKAPFLRRYVALDVGRHVFAALNSAELGIAVSFWLGLGMNSLPTSLSFQSIINGLKDIRAILPVLVTVALMAQVLVISPKLFTRAKAQIVEGFDVNVPKQEMTIEESDHLERLRTDIQNQKIPSSKWHIVYVVFELFKVVSLLAFVNLSLSTATSS